LADTHDSVCCLEYSPPRKNFNDGNTRSRKDCKESTSLLTIFWFNRCGDTEAEAIDDHDKNLFNVLTRARENNLKFNKSKLKPKMKLDSYMGHLLTPEGVKVDPAKYKQLLTCLYHSVS